MIVEMRTYSLVPGGLAPYFARYEQEGLDIQSAILGDPVGYYSAETGELNSVVHLWGYSSLEERQKRRVTLWKDERWCAFAAACAPLVLRQHSQLLAPAPFFRPSPARN